MFYRVKIFLIIIFVSFNAIAFEQKDNQAKLYVFVSFSMPQNSMKALIEQARRVNATLVFSGIYESSLKKTTAKLLELDERGVNAIIDPALFKRHQIQSVPTFLLMHADACQDCSTFVDKMIGNVPLEYFLREVSNSGSFRDDALQYLNKYKEGQ